MQNIRLTEIEACKLITVCQLNKRFFNNARKKDLMVGLSPVAQEILNEIFYVILGKDIKLKYKDVVKSLLKLGGRMELSEGII